MDPLAGVQTFARQLLESFGFDPQGILCCGNTETALAQGLEFKPDFLITDWFGKSPLTGLALHQRLLEVKPTCRLSLLSFEVTPDHEAQAKQAGARFLLKKPFTAEDLRRTLHQALQVMAKDYPELHQRLQSVMMAPRPQPAIAPRPIVLPPMVQYKPGDKVRFGDKTEVVECVVVRHGELVVQLKNKSGLIPATKLQKQ
ncbi:response regulator [Paucibacter sp. APW11]|uniref:Response regulator n=1 Tax=Roseateles aquae TaxID=3077235 RepID=A0ABU3PBY2_9BURK|nr:response regulator [Paucibacter sp. APW11]MDT9000074.1 response regulator [Paucibacter sp. APW11]